MTKKLSEADRFTATVDGLQFTAKLAKRSEQRTGDGSGHHIPGTPFVYKHWWVPVNPFEKKPGDLKKGDVVDVGGSPHMVSVVATHDGKMHLGLKKMPEGTKVTVPPEAVKPLGQPDRFKIIGRAGRREWGPGSLAGSSTAEEWSQHQLTQRKMERTSYGEGLGHPEWGQPEGAKQHVEQRISESMKTPTDQLVGAACETRPSGGMLGSPYAARRQSYEDDLRGITAGWDASNQHDIFLIRKSDGTLGHGNAGDVKAERATEYVRINPEDNPAREAQRVEKINQMYRNEEIRNLVAQWATSANDQNAVMLAMQEIAAKEFGIKHPYPWDYEQNTARTVGSVKKTNGAALRDFLRAQYEATQADLKRAGITHLTVYRGYDWQKALLEGRAAPVPDWAQGHERGDVIDVPPQRPLSSWAYSAQGAKLFAGEQDSAVLAADIPAADILSYPQSGFGCLNEDEVVVIGGNNGKAAFYSVGTNLQPLAGLSTSEKTVAGVLLNGWSKAEQDKLFFEAQMFAGLMPGGIDATYILKHFPPKPGMDEKAYNAYLKEVLDKLHNQDVTDPKIKQLLKDTGLDLEGVSWTNAAFASHHLAELMEKRLDAGMRDSAHGHHIPGTPYKYKHGWIPVLAGFKAKPQKAGTKIENPLSHEKDIERSANINIGAAQEFANRVLHPSGDVKSTYSGRIAIFQPEGKRALIQGAMGWDGTMMLNHDVASHLEHDMAWPKSDVIDVEDYDTLFHEMLHSYSDATSREDKNSFNVISLAEMEEGFTTIGSSGHLEDFLKSQGLNSRDTTYNEPVWQHGTAIGVVPKHMTVAEAAKRRASVSDIRNGRSPVYTKLAKKAQNIVDHISDLEGKKGKLAKDRRSLQLADEINRAGVAHKRDVIASLIMRAFGDKDWETAGGMMSERLAIAVEVFWSDPNPGKSVIAWYSDMRQRAGGPGARALPQPAPEPLSAVWRILHWIWRDPAANLRRGLDVLTHYQPKDEMERIEVRDAVRMVARLVGRKFFPPQKTPATRQLAEIMRRA